MCLLIAVCAASAPYWLDLGRFRPAIEARILEATGLRVSIGQVEWSLFPRPALSVADARIDEPDFQCALRGLSGEVRFWPLLRGRIDVPAVEVEEMLLHVPRDPRRSRERWREVRTKLSGRSRSGEPRFQWVRLESIGVSSFRVEVEGMARPLVEVRVRLSDVVSERVAVDIDGRLPGRETDAELAIDAWIVPPAEGTPMSLGGEGRVTGWSLASLAEDGGLEGLLLDLDVEVVSGAVDDFGVAVTARLDAAGDAALGGELAGSVWFSSGGGVEVRDFSLVAGAMSASGGARWDSDGGADFRLDALELNAGALKSMARRLGRDPVEIVVSQDAFARATQVRIHVEDGHLEAARGVGEFAGIGMDFSWGPRVETSRGTWVARGDAMELQWSATSVEAGEIGFSGAYDLKRSVVSGSVLADFARVGRTLIASDSLRGRFESVLRQIPQAAVDVQVLLPTQERAGWVIGAAQPGDLSWASTVNFDRGADGHFAAGDMLVSATLRVEELDAALAGPFRGAGPARVEFTRDAGEGSFEVRIDLHGASVRLGKLVEKRPGDFLQVRVRGEALAGEWRAQALEVACLGERLSLAFTEAGLVAEGAPLDLSALSALLPAGSRAEGVLLLDLDTGQDRIGFDFREAGFRIPDSFELDMVDGRLLLRGGILESPGLRLASGAGECDIRFEREGETWLGSVVGEFLDLNALLEIVDSVSDAASDEAGAGVPDSGGAHQDATAPRGRIDIALDRLRYRDAELEHVSLSVDSDGEGIRLRDIAMEYGAGRIEGHSEVGVGPGAIFSLHLNVESVDSRLFDELLFDGERGFSGETTGTLEFHAPLGDLDSMLASAGGKLAWEMVDGSFGRLGWASRLLAVLRTTEIFALRLPGLRDQGLTFDTCSGALDLVEGRATLRDVALRSPSYAMRATGTIDYAADAMDVRVGVQLLETLNTVVGKVPVLGKIAEVATGQFEVEVAITGSPSAPQFGVSGAGGVIGDTLGAGGQAIQGVAGGLADVTKRVLRRVFRSAPKPDDEPVDP